MTAIQVLIIFGAILVIVALWVLLHRARSEAHATRGRVMHAQRERDAARADMQTQIAHQVAIGQAVTQAILVIEGDRNVIWANPAAQALFGAHLDGRPVIDATRSHELETLVTEAMRSTELLDRTVTLNNQPFAARAAPLPGGGVALALQDLSELQRLGRARRDFVANISHELRTPLASIRLLVDTLQAGALADAATASEMLSKINLEVDMLSQLARELLDLSLIESGQMPFKLAPTDLQELAETQVERFLPQAQQKKLALVVDIAPGTRVLADDEMIGRVLSNLLHNACKFTPAGGRISISTRTENDNVIVSVSDTGPGIPPEELGRIFERFYKVDRARGQSGTGLGLAIARHIVEGHSGRIWAESEPGHGTTFRFTLPVS